MLDFKKRGTTHIQMYEQNNGHFIVRKYENRKWVISYETDNIREAEHWFYWLILLHTNQLKYIHESY